MNANRTTSERQAAKIINVSIATGCTHEVAHAELIAEEWNEQDAILHIRAMARA